MLLTKKTVYFILRKCEHHSVGFILKFTRLVDKTTMSFEEHVRSTSKNDWFLRVTTITYMQWKQASEQNAPTRWLNASFKYQAVCTSIALNFHHDSRKFQQNITKFSARECTIWRKKKHGFVDCQLCCKWPKRMTKKYINKSALRCQVAITFRIWWMIECH